MDNIGAWNTMVKPMSFGGCILDTETQTLQIETSCIRLRSKLWQVLIELVNNPNKLILRDNLIDSIWHGNAYTGEQGLTHAVCHLRRIIKKHNIQAKITTLPKKGYILQINSSNQHSRLTQGFTTTQNIQTFNEGVTLQEAGYVSISYNFN